ncbi:pogo transposable element with KRAB domain [Rhizophagus clarus]|uniref:Pogo transposable element with KRAB domain n=1 Tax=Rhizophagus clarus TaxID=94130 RepID=A0A8H3KTQ5_9GLOM|nr:pogo transposable element with KRAB domain [Rhizophagus clarus]
MHGGRNPHYPELEQELTKRIQYNYPLQFIGNMDETSVAFDLPSSYTIEKRDFYTISIKTTGHERSTFTVILGYMANGFKLLPVVIFKLKNTPQRSFSDENIWSKRADNSLLNSRLLLVLDSFCDHLVDSVKEKLNEEATNMTVISGGLTSKLQLLDVAVNKSFKSFVVNTNGTEDNEIFDYDNLIINEDKENDDGSNSNNELEDDDENEEQEFNNWDEI